MSGWTVEWLAGARDDLRAIYQWLAESADPDTAERVVSGIIGHGERLNWFPARGTPRPDLAQDVRTIIWRRRAAILYRIDGDRVRIVAVRYAGQDWPGLLADR